MAPPPDQVKKPYGAALLSNQTPSTVRESLPVHWIEPPYGAKPLISFIPEMETAMPPTDNVKCLPIWLASIVSLFAPGPVMNTGSEIIWCEVSVIVVPLGRLNV